MAGSCKHGNEPSGSIIGMNSLDQLSVLTLSRDGLFSMEILYLAPVI
jgi:hypothetical protein